MAKLKVFYTDGRVQDVTTIVIDTIAWEDHARARRLPLEAPIRGAAFMTWKALVRTGEYEGPFEDFVKTVEDIKDAQQADKEQDGEEVAEDFTHEGQ